MTFSGYPFLEKSVQLRCQHPSLAEALQAYQVLKRGGLDDDHIVVFHTNDLAGNFMNPHPGQVFNKPGGPDVYAGVPLVRPYLIFQVPPARRSVHKLAAKD